MEVTLWRDEVEMRRPVAAAHERHDRRSRLFVRVEHDGVAGFGEVDPQNTALNGDPSVDEVLDELRIFVVPQLLERADREGAPPSWTRMARFAGSRRASPVAVALVEMALLDRELRAASQSVATLWPVHFDTPLQATVSLLDDESPWVLAPGVVRVRAKTAPGALGDVARRRLEALRVPVILDFNCSAGSLAEVIEQLAAVSPLARVAAVEQPFAPGNVVDHAALASTTDVPVSLDEGVRTQRDLAQIVRYGAAQIVCIKPARVGGLANARTLVGRATDLGLRPYLGGFFESPFARSVHRHLARHCVSEPSDLVDVARTDFAGREVEDTPGGFGLAPSTALLEHARVIATLV